MECTLAPGVSINKISNCARSGVPFSHISLTEDKVEEYIQNVECDGLTKCVNAKYLDKNRYDVANESLRNFLIDCWRLHRNSTVRIRLTWEYIRSSSHEKKSNGLR
ncbi:MAG: hypothetical protein WBX01_00075 [Nitrososphaeraceae archaeon]|jgi:hypothetical protein